MRFVTKAQKHVSAFISHSAENNSEAKYYEKLLKDAGFSAFQYGYGLHPGKHVRNVLFEKINECNFFLFLISDFSLASPWVQRELGLAVALNQINQNYKPLIIPLYAKSASWRKSGCRPATFPTRDFEGGNELEPFDLGVLGVRGLDKYANPTADSDDVLINLMQPSFVVTRLDDFEDEATFHETGVFHLYEHLFPPAERDDPEDIMQWTLRSDLGETRTFVLPDKTVLNYTLDSRYFILLLAERAVGLAFLTFDYANELIYGNYIAVQEFWRGGDIASAFFDEVIKVLGTLFPQCRGVVFEVEKFDLKRIEKIIGYLEDQTDQTVKIFSSDDDKNEIRKFLRVAWYQKGDCYFFLDGDTHEPVTCKSPALNPEVRAADWPQMEEDYWIMWCWKPGTPRDFGRAKEHWRNSITCIYIEILAKSLAESFPNSGYWQYANSVINRTLNNSQSKDIILEKYKDPYKDLLRRWYKLRIHLAI